MPKHKEPFTEVGDDSTRSNKRRSKIKKLAISDDGVDWSGYTEDEKIEILASLAADDETSSAIRAFGEQPTEGTPAVESKHVEWFLTGIEKLEQWLIPKLVEKKTRNAETGAYFKIDKDVAAQALVFTAEQREALTPLGVKTANRYLPDKIKKALTMVGPGTEFLGTLLMALQQQQLAVMELQLKKNTARVVHQRAQQGGQRPNTPPMSSTESAPQTPKPNGKDPHATVAQPEIVGNVKEQIA